MEFLLRGQLSALKTVEQRLFSPFSFSRRWAEHPPCLSNTPATSPFSRPRGGPLPGVRSCNNASKVCIWILGGVPAQPSVVCLLCPANSLFIRKGRAAFKSWGPHQLEMDSVLWAFQIGRRLLNAQDRGLPSWQSFKTGALQTPRIPQPAS